MKAGGKVRSVLKVALVAGGLLGAACGGEGDGSWSSSNERAFAASYHINGITIELSVDAPGTAQEGVLSVNDKRYYWMRDIEALTVSGSNPDHISFVEEELAALREVERLLDAQLDDVSDLRTPMGSAWSVVAWLAMAPAGYEIPETSANLRARGKFIHCLSQGTYVDAVWDDTTYFAATSYGNDLGANDGSLKAGVKGPTTVNKRFQWQTGTGGAIRVLMKTDAGTKEAWKSTAYGDGYYPKLVNGTLGIYNSSGTRMNTIATATGANQVRLTNEGGLWLCKDSTRLKRISPDFTSDAEALAGLGTVRSAGCNGMSCAIVIAGQDWGTNKLNGKTYPKMGGCGTDKFGTLDCLQLDICNYMNASTRYSDSPQCADEWKSANEDLILGSFCWAW